MTTATKTAEIRTAGASVYVPTDPCARGHRLRYTCGPCVECTIETTRQRRMDGGGMDGAKLTITKLKRRIRYLEGKLKCTTAP